MLAIWLMQARITPVAISPIGQYRYRVLVEDYPIERQHSWRYTVEILGCADTLSIYTGASAYAYIARDSDASEAPPIRPGDTLWIRTEWRDGGWLGDFDYGQYLRRNGIIGTGWVRQEGWQVDGRGAVRWFQPCELRHRLVARYRRLGFSGHELQTLCAMTLGYKEDLDNDLRQQFQRAGASHILAVSGLHTGIIWGIIMAILTVFGRCKPLYEERIRRGLLSGVVVLALCGYAWMTGMSPSVLRSVLMITIMLIGWVLRRNPVSMNSLMAAAIIILVIRPNDMWSISFWLSFSAVAAIVTLTARAQGYVSQLIAVSVSAQLGTMPICLYCFSQMSNYFLLTNLIVIPLAGVIVGGGIASLALGDIPYLGEILVWCTSSATWIMNEVVGRIEGLPGAVSHVRTNEAMMVLLYGVIISGALAMRRHLAWLIATATGLVLWVYLYTTV